MLGSESWMCMPVDQSQNHRPPPAAPLQAILTHDVMVVDRLRLYAYIRFCVILVVLVAGAIAVYAMGITALDYQALVWLALAMSIYNSAILVLASATKDTDPPPVVAKRFQNLLEVSVLFDFIALTIAVWIVGGARSPFLGFYLFHLVVTAFLLPRRTALLTAALAITLLVLLVLGELSGLIPMHAPRGATPSSDPISGIYALTVILVYSTLFVLISFSATGLVAQLRYAEQELNSKTSELERLSAMRRQFLLLAMHNMNSPLAAVTMLLRNLHSGTIGPLEPAHQDQVGRALNRLDGMDEFLADIRALSELERADLHGHSTEIALEFLLRDVIDEYHRQAEDKKQTLTLDESGPAGLVFGVPRLLREALVNLVTNAIKYTPEGGQITGRITRDGSRVRAQIIDNGVGIAPKDIDRLFEEFVRVDRKNPATKKEKGSGLGLSLVKRIAIAHAGTVGVESTPGKGSAFWIELPACGSPNAPVDPTHPASNGAHS